MSLILFFKKLSATAIKPVMPSSGNAGIDLHVPNNIIVPANARGFKIHLGYAVQFNSNSYMLVPRSSISKTPLRMSNSIGIIDSTYRGELIFCVDNLSDSEYQVEQGQRLCQIVLPSMETPDQIQFVDELSETARGSGGFGSTGI